MQMFADYAGATDVNLDAQGRIAIPANIASLAKIDKATVIVGMGDHVEIWDPTAKSSLHQTNDTTSTALLPPRPPQPPR